jgi:hypothetical protein
MSNVHVLDSICGSGKTESMIKYINNSKKEDKFLYITPYLTEVQRIIDSCPSKHFKQPEVYGTKMTGIKFLFRNGLNIVTTHSLFMSFNEEIIDLTKLYGYTLIMDEVSNVVEPMKITKSDSDIILKDYVILGEDNKLIWTVPEYDGKLSVYKKACELNSAYLYSQNGRGIILWVFPVSIFKAFKEIFILTYMFDCQIQKYYYDYYNVEYDYYHIEDNNLVEGYKQDDNSFCKSLINICDSDSLNRVGIAPTALSKTWYMNAGAETKLKVLKNNCYNYFSNISKTPSKKNMWTTFKNYQNKIKGNRYARGFVAVNARATNDLIEKESVAYLCNIYLNPVIKSYFSFHDVIVNEDKYALSELIQFLFRTQLREGKSINLYIPSKRMRTLLIKWLNNEI